MTVEEMLLSAMAETGIPVAPLTYLGAATEYLVFTYSAAGVVFADSQPDGELYSIQLHHYLPHRASPYSTRSKIYAGLAAHGCTYPDLIPASDEDGQHWVFEFEWVRGLADG